MPFKTQLIRAVYNVLKLNLGELLHAETML